MFGFIVGTACLIGLVKLTRGGGCGRWGRHRWGHGGRWMFRRLFERLDTTPGQEKVILTAAEEIQKGWAKVWDELDKSRAEVARAMRGERFDQAAVRELFARQEAALEEARKLVIGELAKVHEALDERQRREVGDLLEHGFRGGRGDGGCGGWGRWRSARADAPGQYV